MVDTYIIHEQPPSPGGHVWSVRISWVKLEICTIRAVAKRSVTLKLQAITINRAKLSQKIIKIICHRLRNSYIVYIIYGIVLIKDSNVSCCMQACCSCIKLDTFPSLSSDQFPMSTPVEYFCSILQPGSCHLGSPRCTFIAGLLLITR